MGSTVHTSTANALLGPIQLRLLAEEAHRHSRQPGLGRVEIEQIKHLQWHNNDEELW